MCRSTPPARVAWAAAFLLAPLADAATSHPLPPASEAPDTLPARLVATAPAAESAFSVPAWAFDRGNAKTFTTQWADAEPMVAFGGASPVFVEYDIDFPLTADYTLNLCYAAASARLGYLPWQRVYNVGLRVVSSGPVSMAGK